MKIVSIKVPITLLIMCVACVCAQADVIRLKTGKSIDGEILLQNEQVVVLRDRTGAKFQYPMAEVAAIDRSKEAVAAPAETKAVRPAETERKAMFRFELAGGLGMADKTPGGAMAADLLVGGRRLAGREIFLGGGVGYHGIWADGRAYHFLPIQICIRYTILQDRPHSPYLGVGIGYGAALSRSYVGGIYSGLDFGYRYLTPRRHKTIAVGVFAHIQGCRIPTFVSIPDDDEQYAQDDAGRLLSQVGLKISFGL